MTLAPESARPKETEALSTTVELLPPQLPWPLSGSKAGTGVLKRTVFEDCWKTPKPTSTCTEEEAPPLPLALGSSTVAMMLASL